METTHTDENLPTILARMHSHQIILNNLVQRFGDQWSLNQKQLLMDSIIQGFPIPPVFTTNKFEDGQNKLDVIDGKQRLTTIAGFYNNEFKLSTELKPISAFGQIFDITDKYFDELPDNFKNLVLNNRAITIYTIGNVTEYEVLQLFSRLNNGTPLSTMQKTRGLLGNKLNNRMNEIVYKIDQMTNIRLTTNRKKRNEELRLINTILLIQDTDIMANKAFLYKGKVYTDIVGNNMLVFSDYLQKRYSTGYLDTPLYDIEKAIDYYNKATESIILHRVNYFSRIPYIFYCAIISINMDISVKNFSSFLMSLDILIARSDPKLPDQFGNKSSVKYLIRTIANSSNELINIMLDYYDKLI